MRRWFGVWGWVPLCLALGAFVGWIHPHTPFWFFLLMGLGIGLAWPSKPRKSGGVT